MTLEPLAFWKARSVLIPAAVTLLVLFGVDVPALLGVANEAAASNLIDTTLVSAAGFWAVLRERRNPARSLALTDANLKRAAELVRASAPLREKASAVLRGLLK